VSWFNKFNALGQTVGDGRVWLDEDRILRGVDDNTATVIEDTVGLELGRVSSGFNHISAGGGQWLGVHSARRDCTRYIGTVYQDALPETTGAVSRDGSRIVYLSPWLTEHKDLYTSTGQVLASGPIMDFNVSGQACVWAIATGMYTKAFSVLTFATGEVIDASVLAWEGAPILIEAPDGLWLLTLTQEPSLLLRPVGSTVGYRIPGIHHGPDAIWLDGRFKIVSNSDRGETQWTDVSPSDPRVELRVVTPPPDIEPPPPPPEKPMSVPQSEQDRAQAMLATVRAELNFGPNQPPFPYVQRVAQRLGGEWGLNGKRGNPNDPSGDILAYRLPGQPQLYDVLQDGGGANGVAWQPLEYPQTAGAVWLDPGGVPDEPEEPEPPTDLTERVQVLEARADIQGMNLQTQATRINLLQAELAALKLQIEDRPDPPPSFESIYVTVRAGTKTYAGTLPVEG
jgi:hypothetical protein